MSESSPENQDLGPTTTLEQNIADFHQIVSQENNIITITQSHTNENRNLTVELPAKKFDPDTNIHSATQDTQSNLGSPIRLNFLVEVASPSLLKTTLDPSEDSQSFILGQGGSESAETNINAKISQILIEPPIIPPRIQLELIESPEPKISIAPPPLLNLNFSLGADLNFEATEVSESVVESQTQFRKKRKNKNPSRVTFDDSLNIDIIYDPEVPSDQYIKIEKSSEASKKPEFISVYSNRPAKIEEEMENRNNLALKEKRKHDISLEYKPDTSQNEDLETDQNNGLFEGISNSSNEPSELRLSKMSEDQAARVFEARKNDIFEGLKKLNKNRPYNALPKSPPNHVFANRRSLANKNENRKILSQSYDENEMKPRVTGLIIENIENKRPKSSQRAERKSWTPQKVSKFLSEAESEKKNDQAKVFNIDLNKKGRSISQQLVKPIEPDYKLIPISNKAQKDKKMIDEMYKLAKEDVQKRIASIEKTLVGTADPDPSRKIAEKGNPVVQNQLSRASQNTDSTGSLRQPKRETPEINSKVDEIVVDLKQGKKKTNSTQPKKESPYSGAVKVTPTKVKTAIYDFEALERQRMKNNSFSVSSMEKDQNKNANKNDQSNSAGKYLSTLESQQLAQDPKVARSSSKSRSDYETKPVNPRMSTPSKTINSPPKFTELEAFVSQRNSYSRMHNEKFKGLFTSPKNQNKSEVMTIQSENLKKSEVFSAYDVAKQYTDIKKNLYVSTFNKLNSRQPQEINRYKTTNKNEEVKYPEKITPQDKKDEKEVKQYTLRPHPPADKVSSHRKNNSTSLASPPQSESQNKLTKSSLQTEIEKYINMTSPKDNKATRSSSVTAMKAAKPQPSPKLQPESRKLKAYDPFGDLTSPKNLKPMAYVLSPTRPSDSNKVENKNSGRLQATPSQRSANRSPLFDSSRNSSGAKSEYLKSLFFSQKKEVNSTDQSKSQKSGLNKSNMSNSDNVEDLSNKNYKFLEIRNNQYVFLNQ